MQPEEFNRGWEMLGCMFDPNGRISFERVELYYKTVRHLSYERWLQVCECAIAEATEPYLPMPAWFTNRAKELGTHERTSGMPALKEGAIKASAAPFYVREYMRRCETEYRRLWDAYLSTSNQARSRLIAKYPDMPASALGRYVEVDSAVVTAERALDDYLDRGTLQNWEQYLMQPWHKRKSAQRVEAVRLELEAAVNPDLEEDEF